MLYALKEDDITVVVTNPPTADESQAKIKALSEFLGEVWQEVHT
jgi:hypothetical protein